MPWHGIGGWCTHKAPPLAEELLALKGASRSQFSSRVWHLVGCSCFSDCTQAHMGNPNWTQEDRKGERKMRKEMKKRKTRHEIKTGKEDWGGYDQDP